MRITLNIVLLFLTLPAVISFAQDNPNSFSTDATLSFRDTTIRIGSEFIMQYSEKITLDSGIILKPSDYKIDYRNGEITFDKSIFTIYNLDTSKTYSLKINYDIFPYKFPNEFSNFDLTLEKDTVTGDTVQIATQKTDFIDNIFEGTDLEKSGSLFRGFTFGSNRDVTLNSGFRLKMNGKVTSDIEITAALTDEDTPIQPEGNTQKLQELDKVFIELRSNNITSTIGDIDINMQKSEFVNFSRKIQGAKGYGDFGFGDLFFAGAVSRGKYATNSFNGLNGVQGPYRLIGNDNEVDILVLSGSEKVYLDGIVITRGDNADYTIDYGIGEITFTNNRIINSNSRIVVDFEYSDRRYSRTLLAGNGSTALIGKDLTLGVSYVNEFDSKDNTIDFELSDQDKQILENAGSDRFSATKSGVTNVGIDSATGVGNGYYIYVQDSVLSSNDTVSFYRFSPGTDSSIYQVTFSFVGQGNGSYIKRSTFEYDFAGINGGNYDTIVFIPIPTAYQVGNLNLTYSPGKNKEFTLNLETAYSYLDGNLYSTDPTSKVGGVAFNGSVGYTKNNFKLFGFEMNNVKVSFENRVINKDFNSLDRINPVEFNRNFNVQDSSKLTENLRLGTLSFSPSQHFSLSYNYGQLLRGDEFNSLRNIGKVEFRGDSLGLPYAEYSMEILNSEYTPTSLKGDWIKHSAEVGYRKPLGESVFNSPYLEVKMTYFNEDKEDKVNNGSFDSLQASSFADYILTPSVSLNNILNFDMYAEYSYRKDKEDNLGQMIDLSNTYTQRFGLVYKGLQWLSIGADVGIQDKQYTQEGIQLGNADNLAVLVNSQVRIDPFDGGVRTDLYYKVASERTAKIERLFVFVGIGQGNYKYVGDLNNNGLQDENEFELTNYDGDYVRLNIPLDEFFPTVALNSSARINIKPWKFFNVKTGSIFGDIFNNLSMETFFRVDEKSKDPNTDNVYFIRLNTFLNDSNTVQGLQLFQQDINVFENNPDYSLRARFLQQRGANQLSVGNENSLHIEKSVRLKLALTEDIGTQLDFSNITDRNIIPVTSIRNRNVNTDNTSVDFSYTPVKEIESGFTFGFARATDFFPTVPTDADINQQILRFIYSFIGAGRIRLELERDEVLLSNSNVAIPYELTNGRVEGKSYFWRAILDYSLTKNIQASVNYNGRIEGSNRVIHTGQAQVTAFF
ncbi:MAG: hypothetical protein KDC42_04455 [Ignavibacteriae bacterium]|nr:hypothetical protein [Ignavibacteriota bacterium]